MSRFAQVAMVAAASLVLAGCDDWGDWGDADRYKEDFSQRHALKSGGRISVENRNGSIEIYGWDREEVEIMGTKYASREELLKAIEIDVVATADAVRIRTVSPSGHRGNHGARYVIRVPRKAEIERVTNSNGRIMVEALEGAARLRTSNGSVKTLRVRGAIEVDTSNGSVEVTEHYGPATLHTTNGSIRAEDIRGYLDATTSNGSITARLADPEPGRPVKLQSSNGRIDLTLERWRNNDVRASTSNSSITVRIPADARANLRARTSNASVGTDFDLAEKGQTTKHSLEGAIGGGGPVIDLTSSNGSIRINKI